MGARDYSVTAASNLSVQGISLAEGMARASVNNAQRAQLADIADLLLDLGGSKTTTGTAAAYLLALDTAPTSYANNLFFLATSHASNTGAATLNVNGLGVKAIEKLAAGAAVSIGAQDFPAGHVGIFTYSSANNSFLMLNPATALPVGAASANFAVQATAEAAATAGTIPSSLDIIEVLGSTTPGDDTNRPFTRELADPGVGDRFEDDDGTWWVAAAQGLHRVDGMVSLRTYAPIDGRNVHLAYHTTAGDLGAGQFCGATGAAAGTFVDDDGITIVPTGGDGSTAWLRIWDGMAAHVGWFGARCTPADLIHDDYPAVKRCLDLFTNGRSAIRSGVVDIGPGFSTSHPIIIGGNNATSFKLLGHLGRSRGGQEVSLIRYIGTESTHLGTVTLYAANESALENINIWPGSIDSTFTTPMPGCWNSINIISDNTLLGVSITAPVTAGTNRVITIDNSIGEISIGTFLGLDAGGPLFEIVYVIGVNLAASQITVAKCEFSHAAGVQIGGGNVNNGCYFVNCRPHTSVSPFKTILAADSTVIVGIGERTFTPGTMTNINVGDPVRIGKFSLSETVYVKSITGTTFNAVSFYEHFAGDQIMMATAGVCCGNRLAETVQAAEVSFWNCQFQGLTIGTGYACFRQTRGGNVKNFLFHHPVMGYAEYGIMCEDASGAYGIYQPTSSGIADTVFYMHSAQTIITGFEDESQDCYWLRGAGAGSNPGSVTFIGASFEGSSPRADGEVINYNGALTFIGCLLQNQRPGIATPPVIAIPGIEQENTTTSLTLIGCQVYWATATTDWIRSSYYPNSYNDVVKSGLGRLTMLGCTGCEPGGYTAVSLPTMLPRHSRWESTVVKDPVSLSAGAATAIFVTGISGAALGDLVDASFSLDLQGIALHAWVSAADVVSYQFSNPTAGTIDLGSGTVKCRVKK